MYTFILKYRVRDSNVYIYNIFIESCIEFVTHVYILMKYASIEFVTHMCLFVTHVYSHV